jgi:hypothetical protein
MNASLPPLPISPSPLRRRAVWAVIALLALTVVAAIVTSILLPPYLSEYVERQFIERTNASFDGTVTVSSMHVTLFPEVQVHGQGLVLKRTGFEDQPPLIEIDRFGAHTTLSAAMRGRLGRLEVSGARIYIPPDQPGDDGTRSRSVDTKKLKGLSVSEVICTGAVLTIAPDDADGTPQIFDIQRVRLENFSVDRPAAYEAELINPRPRGPIVSRGQFGPWNREMPRLTALNGEYTMTAADMSVFNGISGALTSNGTFSGVLESISVTGTSTMNDFSVDVGKHPMPLDTSFDARVDGTNGNTYLNRVDATLGQSKLTAKGRIAGTPGTDGKRIVLDVTSDAGRLEDFIYLVLNERVSPVSGRITLHTKLDLPPGEAAVPERIRLDGTFTIANGQFANPAVQTRIDELSRRGRGRPQALEIDDVVSTFSGQYSVRNGVLSLPSLNFMVRGAEVRVGGKYTLRSAALEFSGHLRLSVPLSQTTTGYKSWLLKPIDPLFRKNGAGAQIPIKLGGTAHQPSFGLNMRGL